MNTINRQELKNRLLQEGYVEDYGLDKTIDNLLGLNGEAAKMLQEWVDHGKVPEFEAIEGIDSNTLRVKLGMKEPAIILSYGMLKMDPKINSIHLKNLLNRRMD